MAFGGELWSSRAQHNFSTFSGRRARDGADSALASRHCKHAYLASGEAAGERARLDAFELLATRRRGLERVMFAESFLALYGSSHPCVILEISFLATVSSRVPSSTHRGSLRLRNSATSTGRDLPRQPTNNPSTRRA